MGKREVVKAEKPEQQDDELTGPGIIRIEDDLSSESFKIVPQQNNGAYENPVWENRSDARINNAGRIADLRIYKG